jgi:hypothetical protein
LGLIERCGLCIRLMSELTCKSGKDFQEALWTKWSILTFLLKFLHRGPHLRISATLLAPSNLHSQVSKFFYFLQIDQSCLLMQEGN